MAEARVSRLLERLTRLSAQLKEEGVSLGAGVEKQVENFMADLKGVQSVLGDAEMKQLKNGDVRYWLIGLEQVCYQMDTLLDKLSVQFHRQATDASSKKKKVCLPILSADSFCLGLFGRGEVKGISSKIRKIGARLREITYGAKVLALPSGSLPSYRKIERSMGKMKRQKVLSLVNRDRVFGREEELQVLLNKLLSEGSEHKVSPVVISIVGMGGIGKTSLARLAYNDGRVSTHFEERIWVTVSDPFDVVNITKAIIHGTGGDIPYLNELEALSACMSECIRGKRFILVLDDVWNPFLGEWEMLKEALECGAVGSRVLVTTRNQRVATMMRSRTLIVLPPLSEDDCFRLFHDCAQFDRERDGSAKYEDISRALVKKCKGLPHVIKILGSLMLYKETAKEWEDVLKNKIWELQEIGEQVFQVLLLTYYDLTPAIRPCLLYCAIFPKDFVIDRDSLVELWMSQDYLSSEENEDKETVGKRCFEDLVIRSFFQDFEKDKEGQIRWCRMHDTVHDFLQYLTKDEFIFLEKGARTRRGVPSIIHHLTLECASEELSESYFPISNCKNLRTVTTLGSEISSQNLDLIFQLRYLRTLSLNCVQIHEVPTSIGGLVHLRYLCLSYNRTFKELPSTMCDLFNLQTLHLISCERLEKLPEGMDQLGDLRNLHVTGCRELVYLPEVIGKLDSLRSIDLSDNRSLIRLPNGLCDLNNLQTLRLSQCEQLEELPEAIGEMISLRHLHVDGCNELKYLPEGIGTLNNLQTLCLNGCKQLVKLPEAIGNLIGLKHLHAAHCTHLLYLPEGIGKLVRLRDIDLSHNLSLKELPSTMCNMLNLRTLCLDGCPGLVNVNVGELVKDEQHEVEFESLQEAIGRFTRLLKPLGCDVSSDDNNDALFIKSLGNVKDVSEVKEAELENVILLRLELDFDNEEDERRKGDADLLNVLQPSQVEILLIAEYHGITVPPNWAMPLQNLKHIILEDWTYCEALPPLGKLSSLEILDMSGMHGLKKIGAEFLGTETDIDQVSFPTLKHLSFRVLQNWEEWEGVEGCTIMPVLSSLKINSCSLLQKLPQFLWKTPLDELVIDWCPVLTQDLQVGGRDWSKISHIPSITINRNIMGRETEKVGASKVDDKKEDEITEV